MFPRQAADRGEAGETLLMKRIIFFWLTLGAAGGLFADEAVWLTSFPDAAAQATKENKLVLLDFTGSDWCGWCKRLDSETFSQQPFVTYAGQNLVLVEVDFPRGKPQSDDQKNANRSLAQKYNVTGYPTVIVTKPDGTELWEQRGYTPGGPPSMINAVNKSRQAAGLPILDTSKPAPMAGTAPPPAPGKKWDGQPKLQAILYSSAHSSIVLDGTPCEEGETIHGMRVVKIERDQVTVEFQGKTKVLTLN
jgi:thioredoxin-related protein